MQMLDVIFHSQVNSVQEESAELQGSYAGDKQDEIKETEREVVEAWNHLTGKVRHRTKLLDDSDDYYKFCIAVQDQLGWMNDMQRQILTYDKSRYGVLSSYIAWLSMVYRYGMVFGMVGICIVWLCCGWIVYGTVWYSMVYCMVHGTSIPYVVHGSVW